MADPAVDLWASDEVHFQQHGSRCRMGVPPETKDPILLHHPARRSAGYFGAVRLRDGRFWSCRETGKFNAETFWEFMKQLQQVSRMGGRRVAVIADNARYHHARLHKAWREENAPGFELDYLPPYSPGLNPIERVWKLTRRRCLHNRYFATLEEVIAAAEAEFATWASRTTHCADYAQVFKLLYLVSIARAKPAAFQAVSLEQRFPTEPRPQGCGRG